jgi:hypothetical protein
MMDRQFFIGLCVGVLAPIISFAIYVLFYLNLDLYNTIDLIIRNNKITHVISLSVLVNLLIFFMKIYTNREKAARGILAATIIYGLLIMFLKLSN